jgi:DNA-binding PadR family transcriptional regulator
MKLMSDAPQQPDNLLPLTPAVFHIMLALADGEKHGYGIMQEVIHITNGEIRMGPGTLYGTIKRMIEAGFIEETAERSDPLLDDQQDQRRRYYRLTDLGNRVARAETLRLSTLLNVAQAKKLIGVAQ